MVSPHHYSIASKLIPSFVLSDALCLSANSASIDNNMKDIVISHLETKDVNDVTILLSESFDGLATSWFDRQVKRISRWNMGLQIQERLDAMRNEAIAKRHVAFVAREMSNDGVVGFIELGLVNLSPEILPIVNKVIDEASRSSNGTCNLQQKFVIVPLLGNVAVKISNRRKGIGKALMKLVMEKIESWPLESYPLILCAVRSGNKHAIALYEKFGFFELCRVNENERYSLFSPRRSPNEETIYFAYLRRAGMHTP